MTSSTGYEHHAGPASADAMQGRATGALFFVGFGAMWLFVGLKQTHHASRLSLLLLGLGTALLLALVMMLMRRSADLPQATVSKEEDLRTQRMFNAVNIIQWVSVATAIVVLNVLHLTVYIVPAVAVIVGLHLFPLAAAFRNRQHYATGSLLVCWPLGCLAALPQTRISGVCALGVGSVLLCSATLTLLRSFSMLRAAVPAAVAAQIPA